jgi:hypothetical protein
LQSSGYKTLNKNIHAVVLLFRKNHQRSQLHFLQYESVEVADDNAKKEEA